MYNYEFKDEKILLENKDGLMEIDNNTYRRSIVITNQNILIFNDVNKNNPLNGRAVSLLSDYLLDLSIPLENIDYKIEDNNTIINYNNKEIVLYNILLNEYL